MGIIKKNQLPYAADIPLQPILVRGSALKAGLLYKPVLQRLNCRNHQGNHGRSSIRVSVVNPERGHSKEAIGP